MKRNTLLVGWGLLVAAIAGATVASGTAALADPPKAAATLAIVVSEVGTSRGAVDIAYPPDAEAQQIEADLAAFTADTGWQPGPVKWDKTADSTTVHFAVSPGPHAVASQGLPIWPLLVTFRAYPSIEVAYLGIGNVTVNEQFSNRFVGYSVRGSGGIATYSITIKDPSFSSVAEVSAPDRPAAPKVAGTSGEPTALLWALLGLAAVGLAGAAYWLSRRAIRARRR